LFTAFCTETYPDIDGFFTGLFRISAREIHRLLHRVIHRFSTIFPPVVDRLVLRQIAGRAASWPGAPGVAPAAGLV
jgi:hypothetical protein